MEVTYLDHMGSDLSVVNAARVSFAKRSDWGGGDTENILKEGDARLIRYLAEHKHVLPFRHPHVSFHFKAPIFVARQLVKHQVGMSWSEISRRYVVGGLEFYWPTEWREVAPDKKQGSKDTGIAQQRDAESVAQAGAAAAVDAYEALVDMGVAPEQARMVLPLNLYSEWHWTGSLLAWAHVWNLRTEAHAQKECQDCVRLIGPKMKELFPVSWEVLTGGE
jgi:thymidylate synthase (FAD)